MRIVYLDQRRYIIIVVHFNVGVRNESLTHRALGGFIAAGHCCPRRQSAGIVTDYTKGHVIEGEGEKVAGVTERRHARDGVHRPVKAQPHRAKQEEEIEGR